LQNLKSRATHIVIALLFSLFLLPSVTLTRIEGVFPLIGKITLSLALISGKIPAINSKNVKMKDFYLINRKFFPYIPQNNLHSAINRKFFSYFTFANFSIKCTRHIFTQNSKTASGIFSYHIFVTFNPFSVTSNSTAS
jgi:hypothetical protein